MNRKVLNIVWALLLAITMLFLLSTHSVKAANIVVCDKWDARHDKWVCEPNLGSYEFPLKNNWRNYYTISVVGSNLVIKGDRFITPDDVHDTRVFLRISQYPKSYYGELDVHSEGIGETAQDSILVPMADINSAGIIPSSLTVDNLWITDRDVGYVPCISGYDPQRVECAQCYKGPGYDGSSSGDCTRVSTFDGTGGCGNGMCACPKATQCSCVPRSCPPATPKSKFRTTATSNGTSLTCSNQYDCNPSTAACAPSYINSAPSCSITPTTVSGTRGTGGTAFTITANDPDYGDEVRITGFNVKDTAGNLTNCATLQTVGGGAALGATVKLGYPDSNPLTSQSNTFVANPDLMHGIYENVNGQSVCSGKLTVEISDTSGDTPDSTSYASCSVNIEMRNNVPTISDIKVTDQDTNAAVRKPGNLIDGSTLFIGSSMESKRVSYCSTALSTSPLGDCDTNNKVALMSRKNPFTVEYTVTDADGVKDILQAGLWIQLADQNPNVRTLPTAESGARKSIQVLYSEKENFQNSTGKWYYNSRACVGNTCSPNTMIGSPKLSFTAYSLVVRKDFIIPITANATKSPYQYSTFRQWQKVGFPDCFLTVAGCTDDNVPAASKLEANYVTSQFENYDWIVQADSSSLVCYRNYAIVPEVIQNTDKCPPGCAACAAKLGVDQLNATQATFKYKIFFNDRDEVGAGMDAGPYRIFVEALDKVGTPLQNVKNKGDEGWMKFDRNGQICTDTCAVGDFILNYDPIAPKINSVTWDTTTAGLTATILSSEASGESGLAGGTNRYIARQTIIPPGAPIWAKKGDGTTDFDGASDHFVSANTQTQLQGTGLLSGESIIAGMCAYDNAGNMSCNKNSTNYYFATSWLKTSLGDVYSNSSSGGTSAFMQSLPDSNDNTSTGTDSYSPLQPQADTMATGVISTATQTIGVTGGNLISGVNYPLGFANNYRMATSSVFNLTGLVSTHAIDDYSALHTLVSNNCESINQLNADTCKTSTTITSTVDDTPFKLITLGNSTIGDIVCKNVNIIFVQGKITLNGKVTKATETSACAFIISSGSELVIGDSPSDIRGTGPDSQPSPSADRFEGAVIAAKGATITVDKALPGSVTSSIDRLEIKGFLYAADQAPVLKRSLIAADSKKYPAEWIIYDASLLDSLRPILGLIKTADVVCGISNHILCGK